MNPFPPNIHRIGVFSLSGYAQDDDPRPARGLQLLRDCGLDCVVPAFAGPRLRGMAASDQERANAFNQLLQDPSIDALLAMRGGYGITRLLDRIDWETLRSRDLPLIGYSDVSALLLTAYAHGCRNLIHGPMVVSEFGRAEKDSAMDATLASWARALRGDACPLPEDVPWQVLQSGSVAGPLVPTNLSLLTALVGTGRLPSLEGTILAVEDVGEPTHAIDRMFTQLFDSGTLDGVSGLLFGQFSNGEDAEFLPSLLSEVAERIAGPVVAGLPFGHVFPTISLRVGSPVQLDTSSPKILTSLNPIA